MWSASKSFSNRSSKWCKQISYFLGWVNWPVFLWFQRFLFFKFCADNIFHTSIFPVKSRETWFCESYLINSWNCFQCFFKLKFDRLLSLNFRLPGNFSNLVLNLNSTPFPFHNRLLAQTQKSFFLCWIQLHWNVAISMRYILFNYMVSFSSWPFSISLA